MRSQSIRLDHVNLFIFGIERFRGDIPFIRVNPIRLHGRRPVTITAFEIHKRAVRAATDGLHVNSMIQLEGAWIKRTFAQGGELRVAIFEAPDVRREGCRAALRFQVTMAFGAAPLACRAYVYATTVFAVTRGAFEGSDLIGVMDRAIVATQARGVGGLCGKCASLRHMARCALVFEDGVCRGHTAAAINARIS